MIKKICLLITLLFVFVPFAKVIADEYTSNCDSKETLQEKRLCELRSECENSYANRKNNSLKTNILYEIKGLSFAENGLIFKGWAVFHDVDHNLTNYTYTKGGISKNTSIYIQINGNQIRGSQVVNCEKTDNGNRCYDINSKSFKTNENVKADEWVFSEEGTYYLKNYDLYNYFFTSDSTIDSKINYFGNYFFIFIPYDLLDSENEFKICAEHTIGGKICESIAVDRSKIYLNNKQVTLADGTISEDNKTFEVNGLGDYVFVNYSSTRKTTRDYCGERKNERARWCASYKINTQKIDNAKCSGTVIATGTEGSKYSCKEGERNKSRKFGFSPTSYCPTFYRIKYSGSDSISNYVDRGYQIKAVKAPDGSLNCGGGYVCLNPGEGGTKDYYISSTFVKVVGSLKINMSSSYEPNLQQCNVKNTLKVSSNITSDSEYQDTSYYRYNKQNKLISKENNYFNEYFKTGSGYFHLEGTRFKSNDYRKTVTMANPYVVNGEKYSSANGGKLGGDCIQTVKVKLSDGSYAYANVAFSEISTWSFVPLPNNVESGRPFGFGINYISELKWDIVNNIALKNGKADSDVWVLIEKDDKYYKSEGVIHNEAVNKIAEYVEKKMYKDYTKSDNLTDVLKIPKDNASSEPTDKEMEEIISNWKCEVKENKRTSSEKGSRIVSCYYDLTTYLNKFTAKVKYEEPTDLMKNYVIYDKENKNNCIKTNNGFCLFVSMTYPCYSVVKNEGNVYKGGFPIKYYSYETENSNDEFVTVSQLNFNTKDGGIIKLKTGGQLGIDLDVIYEGRINVGDSKYGSGEYGICLMSLLDYRPINLNNPFPKYLNSAGYNWTNYLKNKLDKTELLPSDYTSSDIFEKNLDPEYEISLNSGIIKSIKDRYTNNYLSFDGISEVSSKATSSFVSNYFGSKVYGRNGIDENKVYKLGCGPANMEWSVCK